MGWGRIPFPRSQREFFEAVFDPATGHNHDGVDSAPVPLNVSMVTDGSIENAKLAVDSVRAPNIQAGQVAAQHYAAKSVDTPAIADSAIETLQLAAAAVTADKLDGGVTIAALQAAGVATFVHVDHADVSPVTLLAGAVGARNLLILVVASETAAGGPDIDIGETGTVDKFIADIGAGAWTAADVFTAAGVLTTATDMIATIAAAGTAGALDILILAFPA